MGQQALSILVLRIIGVVNLFEVAKTGVFTLYELFAYYHYRRDINDLVAVQFWHHAIAWAVVPLIIGLALIYGAPRISKWLFKSDDKIELARLTEKGLGGIAYQVTGLFVLLTYGGTWVAKFLEMLRWKAGGMEIHVSREVYEGRLNEDLFHNLIVVVFGLFVFLRGRWLFAKTNPPQTDTACGSAAGGLSKN